jgi:hypothetical protein
LFTRAALTSMFPDLVVTGTTGGSPLLEETYPALHICRASHSYAGDPEMSDPRAMIAASAALDMAAG